MKIDEIAKELESNSDNKSRAEMIDEIWNILYKKVVNRWVLNYSHDGIRYSQLVNKLIVRHSRQTVLMWIQILTMAKKISENTIKETPRDKILKLFIEDTGFAEPWLKIMDWGSWKTVTINEDSEYESPSEVKVVYLS